MLSCAHQKASDCIESNYILILFLDFISTGFLFYFIITIHEILVEKKWVLYQLLENGNLFMLKVYLEGLDLTFASVPSFQSQ